MRLRVCALLLSACAAPAAEFTYQLRDGAFAIHNGPAWFNRPLFGTHEPSMLLSGDRPSFVFQEPTGMGKVGNLRLALSSGGKTKRLEEFASVDFSYQPGWTRHVLEDPLLPGARLELAAVPLAAAEGFLLRLHWLARPSAPVRLQWTFGGASGAGSSYRLPPLEQLHFTEADAAQDTVEIWGGQFRLTSPTMKGKEMHGRCDLAGRLEVRPGVGARFEGEWPAARDRVHLIFLIDRSDELERLSRDPAATFERSLQHYRALARRVRVKTPDPLFDLAFEAMIIANDGIWRPPAFVHGAVSWGIPYLGWRIWYGADALGFHERVHSSILAFATRQIRSGPDRGALPDTLTSGRAGYNMNEVFLDHVYHHYLWTGDRALLASLYPVIQGILSRQRRRFDPDGNGLYESCLNTWISDAHWYRGGDTTQSSAYMIRGHELAALAAEAAGEDPAPWRREAARIRAAMQEKLWLPERGHFAEFIDRLGLQRLHPEPELPTIYHSIEFGAADPFQAYQMLRFTETTLPNERGLPNGGRLVWSSRWAPNYNRTYTHSTYELAFAEVLNLAWAYYVAGQFDAAYELVRGVYASMYQGAVPGGLPCHAYVNGSQRRNEEFADGISLFSRVAVEGVFGVQPELHRHLIRIAPGFPAAWKEASIEGPEVSYRYRRTDSEIAIDVETAAAVEVEFRVPLDNADAVDARVEPGIGQAFAIGASPKGREHRFRVRVTPRQPAKPREYRDPQRAREARTPGHYTYFALAGEGNAARWEPVHRQVRDPIEILDPAADGRTGECRFRLRNNSPSRLERESWVEWGGRKTPLPIRLQPDQEQAVTVPSGGALLPGGNRLDAGGLASATVPYWPLNARLPWRTIPLDAFFNDSFATILLRKFWTDEPSHPVCCDYAISHLNHFGVRNRIPDDSRLREGVNAQGIFETRYGIPFAQRREGKNMVALSRWPEFPHRVEIPINSAASRIYLLLSALLFPMQSHIENARATVLYADGGRDTLPLENPRNFDNGWGQFGGTYHYTGHGMELLSLKPGGKAPPPPGVLFQHPTAGLKRESSDDWEERPHADIIDVPCQPGRRIRALEFEVLSNDIIVSLLGVTLATPSSAPSPAPSSSRRP